MKIFTRREYIANECSHQEYYPQFVNDRVKYAVKTYIGLDKILASTNEHFNDIPLHLWDNIHAEFLIDRAKFKQANETDVFCWSLSDNVCILKAAARMIKESSLQNQVKALNEGVSENQASQIGVSIEEFDSRTVKSRYEEDEEEENPEFRKVYLEIKFRVVANVPGDMEIQDFINELEYDFTPGREGEIVDMEMLDYEVTDSK